MAYDDDPEGHGTEPRDDYDLNYHPACSACWGRYTPADPAVPVWVGPSASDIIYVHERCKAWMQRSVGQ